MFQSTVISNDGTSALLMGNGDPNGNNVTPPTGITNAIYLNTTCDLRNFPPLIMVWDADNSNWNSGLNQ